MTERIEFAQDWYKRGSESLENENDFEAFIYLWLSLTIASNEHYGNNKKVNRFSQNKADKDITDRVKILKWHEWYGGSKVFDILKENEEDIRELCERKDPDSKEPILDIKINKDDRLYDKVLRDHTSFRNYWQGDIQHINKQKIGETFIHILHDVRNNLFHGDKSYQVESDLKLLEVLSPSLKSIAKLCIDQAK
ncbi:hypothetical protein N8329_00360 [Crocinitomicaceae bacterium]|nr:hypothetical protein [Crocinitomicaceae bacterium]